MFIFFYLLIWFDFIFTENVFLGFGWLKHLKTSPPTISMTGYIFCFVIDIRAFLLFFILSCDMFWWLFTCYIQCWMSIWIVWPSDFTWSSYFTWSFNAIQYVFKFVLYFHSFCQPWPHWKQLKWWFYPKMVYITWKQLSQSIYF